MSATSLSTIFVEGVEAMTDQPPAGTKCEGGCGRLAVITVVISGQVWDLCAVHVPRNHPSVR